MDTSDLTLGSSYTQSEDDETMSIGTDAPAKEKKNGWDCELSSDEENDVSCLDEAREDSVCGAMSSEEVDCICR